MVLTEKGNGRRGVVLYAVTMLSMALASRAKAEGYDRFASNDEIRSARRYAEAVILSLDKVPLNKLEFENIYSESGEALKRRYSGAQFAARINKVRTPLGIIQERKFFGFSGAFNALPNIIAGDYVIVAFSTRFQGNPILYTEQVTLESDRKGGDRWRFVEYYLAPSESNP